MFRIIILVFLNSVAAFSPEECKLPAGLVNEIKSYQAVVDRIASAAVGGNYSGVVHRDLTDFVDQFGNRLAGSDNLELAIDNAVQRLTKSGLSVSTEPVSVPKWTRGKEEAYIVEPWKRKIKVLGLGLTPSTGSEGIEAEVVVIKDFVELQARTNEVFGKIVLYNAGFTSYGQTVKYRSRGPSQASELGAVAALVRSVTTFSISTPHTGYTGFEGNVTKIPCAAVTLEDADMISRIVESGKTVKIRLVLESSNEKNRISRNVFGDLPGISKPKEYVTLSGHIDSWDVGQGALDDAGGAFVSWHALALIKALSLPRTKRTIRSIMWTAEEVNFLGAYAFLKHHQNDLKNWTAAFESDNGVYEALGLSFVGNNDATCIMHEVVSLFNKINATSLQATKGAGSDIDLFKSVGVPIGEPFMVKNNYIWFHHTEGDTMATLKSEDLDQNLALFASTAYVLADLSIKLPRGNETAVQVLERISNVTKNDNS